MILLARASALRGLYDQYLPTLAEAFRAYIAVRPEERPAFLARLYPELEARDWSRDLLGRARGLAVRAWPQEVGWSDVGTPDRLHAWLGADLHAGVLGSAPTAPF